MTLEDKLKEIESQVSAMQHWTELAIKRGDLAEEHWTEGPYPTMQSLLKTIHCVIDQRNNWSYCHDRLQEGEIWAEQQKENEKLLDILNGKQ